MHGQGLRCKISGLGCREKLGCTHRMNFPLRFVSGHFFLMQMHPIENSQIRDMRSMHKRKYFCTKSFVLFISL